MSEIASVIGARIRALRKQHKLSQNQLGERTGNHGTYIGQIERGEKNVSIEKLSDIAYALETTPSELMECLGNSEEKSIARRCYDIILSRPIDEQRRIEEFIYEIIDFKDCRP